MASSQIGGRSILQARRRRRIQARPLAAGQARPAALAACSAFPGFPESGPKHVAPLRIVCSSGALSGCIIWLEVAYQLRAVSRPRGPGAAERNQVGLVGIGSHGWSPSLYQPTLLTGHGDRRGRGGWAKLHSSCATHW